MAKYFGDELPKVWSCLMTIFYSFATLSCNYGHIYGLEDLSSALDKIKYLLKLHNILLTTKLIRQGHLFLDSPLGCPKANLGPFSRGQPHSPDVYHICHHFLFNLKVTVSFVMELYPKAQLGAQWSWNWEPSSADCDTLPT